MVVIDAMPADAAAARPIGVLDVPDRRPPAFDRALENEGGRPLVVHAAAEEPRPVGSEAVDHELVFLLQFGAVISFYAQAYGFTLDVTTRAGLRSMRRAVAWTFVSVLWGRGIRYVIIGTRLLATIQGAGRPTLWKLGAAGLSGMGIFNFVVIVDTARKLWKFCVRTPMPLENARVAKES